MLHSKVLVYILNLGVHKLLRLPLIHLCNYVKLGYKVQFMIYTRYLKPCHNGILSLVFLGNSIISKAVAACCILKSSLILTANPV